MVLRRGARLALATSLALGWCVAITAPTRTSAATSGSGGTSSGGRYATSTIAGATSLRGSSTGGRSASGGTNGDPSRDKSGGTKASANGTAASGSSGQGNAGAITAPSLTPPAGVTTGAARPTWLEAEVTLTVDPSYLALPHAKQALEGALLAWTTMADQLPKVTIRYADDDVTDLSPEQDLLDHRIFFAPSGDKRAKGALAITLVTADENKNSILDADILVNGGHLFTDVAAAGKGQGVTYDLQDVITHELGHWFGLDEDYQNVEATMYAYVYPGELKKRDLAQSDIVAVQLAYWQADNPSENHGCSVARRTASRMDWSFGCWAIAVCLYRRPNRRMASHVLGHAGRLLP